jgi:WhiB family redox-sensing transcriptional regulator
VVSDGVFNAEAAYPPYVAAAILAPCGEQPDLFTKFGDRGARRRARVAAAKQICSGCPLRKPCAEWATRTLQTGVWGGTDEFERAIARRREARRVEVG